ncbi:MAG TPA: bacillithiol biosynthesis cysteine-adding enzyme BshC [Candidatus Acidoferrum sp.]|nr:bacillithiol biosynthesis cysteine-adding enzyme BshC [Candidatus Acidoferrum sp.]
MPMGCVSIPFRRLPHQPKLFVRLIDDYSSVKQFYAHPPKLEEVKRVASSLDYPAERRREVARILREQNTAFGANAAAMSNLEKLERGAVAVVSGQQVGLFGGPAYAVYKAVTAIRLAQELSEAGIPAVPIFWMATEDHDLDEVRHVTWFDSGKLVRFELPADAAAGRPVGQVRLGPAVEEHVKKAVGLLSGPARETISRILEQSYHPEETYGSAFGKLFSHLFAEQGLILLDPLEARLHRIAAPLYKKAIEDRDELNDKLLQRGKELEGAGYDVQVKVTARSTLLFTIRDGVRQPVAASNAHFKSGEATWTREEALRLADSSPETFSANALFRPVVQDYLLPTAAYLGGPAEIAYFAQSSVIYEHLLGRMPVVLPRAGFTILDAKAEKLLQKYGLCIENLWAGPQELRRKMESVSVPEALSQSFDRDKTEMESTLAELGAQIEKLDPTLAGAVATARNKIGFQLEKLRRKTGRALDQKSGRLAEHEQFLESLLYPNKSLQSRELCFLPFLARWGMEGLSELQKLSGSDTLGEHRIVRIP